MFDEFLGVPAHPFFVHFPVVLIPMLIAAALAYVFLPFVRRYVGWVVALLAVAAPLAAWFATLSGNRFRNRLVSQGAAQELLARIDEHRDFADKTLWAALILGAVALAFVAVTMRRERGTMTGEGGSAPASQSGAARVLTVLLAIAVLFFAGASGYYVFKTGDTGAKAVWGS